MSSNPQTVSLQGDLTIHTVARHQQTLLNAFQQNPEEIRIAWGSMERADVAGVQLIHAAYLLARSKGIDLQLERPLPGALGEALEEGGFGYLNWVRG